MQVQRCVGVSRERVDSVCKAMNTASSFRPRRRGDGRRDHAKLNLVPMETSKSSMAYTASPRALVLV